jgi:nucleotidyltransferase substrate binding protein (TIGR01987 family)
MSVSVNELEKAVNTLGQALALPLDDVVRDASIQRFEFCIELAWKTARKTMGTQTTAPKQVVREMAQNGYIDDVQVWFDALEKRNLTSHTYNEEVANQVYTFVKVFITQLRLLVVNLKK